jgi:hypothetical protein
MPDLSPSTLVDFLLAHFAESLSDAIGELDGDIEGHILDSNDLIDIIGLTPDQRHALQAISIRDVLTRSIPDQVAFEEERLEAWGSDAYEFYSKNIDHPEFAKLFAAGLNYAVILQ